MGKVKQRGGENAVLYSVFETLRWYGVRASRMQSRTFSVPGAGGKTRPLFVGEWQDDLGTKHRSGMADILARPRINAYLYSPVNPPVEGNVTSVAVEQVKIAVPLWIECKQPGEVLSADQEAFRHHVTNNGEFHVVIEADLRPLTDWLDKHGLVIGNRRP